MNLILCDGAKLTVNSSENGIDGSNCNLTIYGQILGTGELEVNGRGDSSTSSGIFVSSCDVTINGGSVYASGEYGISAGTVTINGGSVTASGTFGISPPRATLPSAPA